MFLLYVLLVTTASVLGSTDLDEVCPLHSCTLYDIKTEFSAKEAPEIFKLILDSWGDSWEVLKLTPNLDYLGLFGCSSNCSLSLEAAPPMPYPTVLSIWISNLTELHNDQFVKFSVIERLFLGRNSIERLSRGTFQNLSELDLLDLSFNLIKTLPKGVFYPLEKVRHLYLGDNLISVITEDTFINNKQLNWLSLNNNPLIRLDFPINIPNWTMYILDLTDCGQLRSVQLPFHLRFWLDLENSGVERLQAHQGVRKIMLANSSLTHLSLRGSQSEHTLDPICDIQKLQWLDLSNTSMNTSMLHRTNNTYGDCPLPNLKFLNLSSNQLVTLPRESQLIPPSLAHIDLSHNKLENIRVETFDEFHDLRSLRLEGNNLESFDYRSFYDKHRNLEELALYDNKFNASYYNEISQYFSHKNLHLIQKDNRPLPGTEGQDMPNLS